MKKQSPNRLKKTHQQLIAKMVQSFILQASHQPPEKVLELYESFNADWHRRVRNINERYGKFVLSFDVWEREWKENGYYKMITMPIPKQLPDEEKKKAIAAKTELVRLVFIIEGKTEHQRQRRELKYKTVFMIMRIKLWVKSLFKPKEIPTMQVV